MRFLGIDLETTDIAPDSEITEIGAILMNESGCILSSYNTLVKIKGEVSPGAKAVSGISTDMCKTHGIPLEKSIEGLIELVREADWIVTHNGIAFDIPILQRLFDGYGISGLADGTIDTSIDVPYPEHIRTRGLTCLAAEHGIINIYPHRALFDVATMMKIFFMYDVQKIVDVASTPLVLVKANVDFNTKDLASSRGYSWRNPPKMWMKRIRQYYLGEERKRASFSVIELPEDYNQFF